MYPAEACTSSNRTHGTRVLYHLYAMKHRPTSSCSIKRVRRFAKAVSLLLGFVAFGLTAQVHATPSGYALNATINPTGQSTGDTTTYETIPLQATVQVSPPQITIEVFVPGTFTISRKDPSVNTWTQVASGVQLAINGTWSDKNVNVGQMYEYQFVNTAGNPYGNLGTSFYPSGYILTGINVDQTQPKGMMAVIAANDLPVNLPAQYAQYKSDLVADGWQVREIQVPRAPDYSGLGNGAIATIKVNAGGTTTMTTGSQVLLKNSNNQEAMGTVTVNSTTGAVTAVTSSISNGGVADPGSAGRGFSVGDVLTMSGGSVTTGSTAYLTANITNATPGPLSSANPITGGSGYTSGQTVTLTGQTSGAIAQGTLNVTNGTINSITVNTSGQTSIFQVGELLTMTGGTGTGVGPMDASEVTNAQLVNGDVTIASGGSGYTNGQAITLTGQTSKEVAYGYLVVSSGQITGFTIYYSDSGFVVGEKLTLAGNSGGSGVGTLTVNAISTGQLTYVQIYSPGTGYTEGETGTLTGNQSGATAQVTLNVYGGYLYSPTVVSSSSGFINGETLTLSGTATGTGAPLFTAYAISTGTLQSVTVNSGGTGYTSGSVLITEGTATAMGTLTVSSGVITAVTVTSPGPGFTAGGYITLAPVTSGVSLSVFTINNNNRGSLVSITSGGSGYSDNDTVTIKGNGSGATAIGSLIAPSGTITGISVVLANTGNTGSFTTGESLTITPTQGGSGVTATVGAPTDNHLQIRSAVQAIYNAYYNNTTQQSQLKNIVMVGKVPVCRSGIEDGGGADGHGNECPYAADAFYAEMLGVIGVDWTDVGNNTSDIYTDVNLPGDMQFDQQKISDLFNGKGVVELGFGRIDLSTNIGSEVDAEQVYFNKLHLYKIADPSFQPGRKVCDRAGWAQVRETDLQSMPGVVGMNNITFIAQSDLPSVQTGQDADQLYSTLNGPYLFYFKDSGGPETGVNGKAVFWTGMQSHWGYWSYNNSMVTDLAANSFTLDYTWDIFGTRYIYHRMGMGLDAGDMMKQSINNQGWTNGPYTYHYDQEYIGESNCQLFMDQMGDPALRFFMFAPPTGLSIVSTAGSPVLTWTASTEPTVTGYHVYRAPYANGQFTRLTTTPVPATGPLTFTDTTATTGSYVYMVRAIRLESTGGGTFYNASLGTTQSFNVGAAPTPVTINTTSLSPIYWNTATSITLSAQGGDPQYTWKVSNGSLPSGLNLSPQGVISGATQSVGSFAFTVQATDQIGQFANQALTLTVNQNSQVTLNPVAVTYTQQSTPTSSYGTSDPDEIQGGTNVEETFQRYNLSGISANNGVVKATLYLYVEPATAAAAFAPIQANLLTDVADSPANFIDNGIAVPFSGAAASPTSGWTRITCPVPYGFTNGTLVTLAGLTGFPTTAYALTVIDAYNFDIHITYGGWAYDPELAYASSIATTYNTRPTAYDPNVPTVTGTGTDTPGTYLQFDVTSFVHEALTNFPDKLMGIRFFTGTPQNVAVAGLHAFGAAIPYLVIQTSNAPSIVVNSPTENPAYLYSGSSILLNTTVTALPSRASNLTLQWSQVSGPGTTTFSNPTAAVTGASFSTPGTYVLQLTANDGVETSSQTISVVTQNNPVTGPNDSMVLRLPFDESSGTTAHDYSGVSPANYGTITADPGTNTLPTWEPSGGKILGALSFAGNNSPGSYQQVVVSDSSTNLLDGMQQIAISFWLYANALPVNGTNYGSNYAGLVVKRLGSFNKESYTIQLRGSSATAASIYTDIGGVGSATLEGASITTGQWYHCVVQFDGTQPNNNNLQMYINGYPFKFASTNQTSVPRNPTANLHIGAYDIADNLATNGGFNGMIDEVRIYNRILTFPEIQALYQAVPADTGPVITTSPTLSGAVGNPLTLSATVTDSKGPGSLSYLWSELNGPSLLTIASPTSIATTTTSSVPGAYNLQFSANDGVVTTVANVAATITGQTYASWAAQNNLTGNQALQTAVTANDGLSNLFKYALGLNPTTNYNPGSAGMPFVTAQNISGTNYLTLTFNGVATDVTYTVQATSNVNGPWTTIKTFSSGGTAPGLQTVQDNQAIGAAGQRFMRLIMSIP